MATLSLAIANEFDVPARAERVSVFEACASESRLHWLTRRLDEPKRTGAETFIVSCDFAVGGPWAGVSELFSTLLSKISSQRQDLIERHAFELVYILPLLRRSVTIDNPNLTDLAPTSERTRNYPADRAVRNVHGLIDLLDEWKSFACPARPWVIGCDYFDEAGAIGALFFRELMRRRGNQLNIRLMAAVAPGRGAAAMASFDSTVPTALLKVRSECSPASPRDRCEVAKEAEGLEEQTGNDELKLRNNLPRLVSLWKYAGRADKTLHYQFLALEMYNTLGLYDDALRYGDGLITLAKQEVPNDHAWRWSIFIKVLMCHLGMDNVEASLQLTEEEGLPLAERNAAWRNQIFYLLAMMYARFKKPRDFAKGEEYLERSLAEISASDLPAGERHFRYVFNRNGLAMVRNFQRRPEEAITLCRDGFAYLNEHLDTNEHRLHRSILLYNIAQVYAAAGEYAEALKYFSATIAMDPNYSEYYNERANVLLQMDRLEEAEADYLRAIELSPPYFEVFTNLGQCYRRMGAMQRAIKQYSRALDLAPLHLLARLGRAKAYEEVAEREAAIAEYGVVLTLDKTLWEAIASRGVLQYEAGRLAESLADFDAAIKLKPDLADLHENRAVVLADMEKLEALAQEVS